ncbi:hypothetical protein ACFQX7_26550 [Luedemannella flava]
METRLRPDLVPDAAPPALPRPSVPFTPAVVEPPVSPLPMVAATVVEPVPEPVAQPEPAPAEPVVPVPVTPVPVTPVPVTQAPVPVAPAPVASVPVVPVAGGDGLLGELPAVAQPSASVAEPAPLADHIWLGPQVQSASVPEDESQHAWARRPAEPTWSGSGGVLPQGGTGWSAGPEANWSAGPALGEWAPPPGPADGIMDRLPDEAAGRPGRRRTADLGVRAGPPRLGDHDNYTVPREPTLDVLPPPDPVAPAATSVPTRTVRAVMCPPGTRTGPPTRPAGCAGRRWTRRRRPSTSRPRRWARCACRPGRACRSRAPSP